MEKTELFFDFENLKIPARVALKSILSWRGKTSKTTRSGQFRFNALFLYRDRFLNRNQSMFLEENS